MQQHPILIKNQYAWESDRPWKLYGTDRLTKEIVEKHFENSHDALESEIRSKKQWTYVNVVYKGIVTMKNVRGSKSNPNYICAHVDVQASRIDRILYLAANDMLSNPMMFFNELFANKQQILCQRDSEPFEELVKRYNKHGNKECRPLF